MNNRSYLIALALVSLAIFFPHLDVVEVNIMEARNFIAAREMLDYGNWIHTTMNLEPRYEKPPLPTWMTALSGSIFGMKSLIGLRLPAALSSVFLIFSFYFLCVKILKQNKQSFIATLILASSFYIIFSGRNGQWDIFAHAFMVFAIFQLFKAFEATESLWKEWILGGFFLGLSFMSKGPVSMFALLLPFLIAYGIVFKYKGVPKKMIALLTSLFIFALVGLSWGLYIYLTDASSAKTIADKETLAWANRSVKPFYHYWSFFIQSGIWTFFSFIALLYPFMIKRVRDKKLYRFSLFWTLSAVVLLSLIPEKKERYLLPVLIPMAMNTSFYFDYLISKVSELTKTDKYIANFGFGLIGFIGLVFPFALYFFFNGNFEGYWTSFFFSSISLFSLGILFVIWLKKKYYERCFYGIILFSCSIILFAFPMAELTYDNDKYLSLETLREMDGMAEIKLYSTAKFIPSPELIFDLGEPIKRVKDIRELPQAGSFALLVNDSIPIKIQEEFSMDYKAQFDINNLKEGNRGHKKRKTMKLYVLEKKE
jgi:4-amino-4-deoxy-L-arabinose transferase-like glycosyltransferase